MRPSRPAAKLGFSVTAECVHVTGLDENAAVLGTKRDVENTMSCKCADNCKRFHFSNLTLQTRTIAVVNNNHPPRMVYFRNTGKKWHQHIDMQRECCVNAPSRALNEDDDNSQFNGPLSTPTKWAGIRKKFTHSLPIFVVIIKQLQLISSIYYGPLHPPWLVVCSYSLCFTEVLSTFLVYL